VNECRVWDVLKLLENHFGESELSV